MAYNKTQWQDLPNETTPVNASNLNKIENELELLDTTTQVINVTASGANLNNYTTKGFYYFDASASAVNIPAGVNGWLQVLDAPNGPIKQIWYRHGTANTNDFETYVRTYSGNWSNWRRLLVEDDTKTTLGTVSYNTTYLDTPETNSITRSGNVVHIVFTAKIKTKWTENTNILTNLPTNKIVAERVEGVYINSNIYGPSENSKHLFTWFNGGTALRAGVSALATVNQYVIINITYICE